MWKRSDLKACYVEKGKMGTVESYFLPKYERAATTRKTQSFFSISHFTILYCFTKNYSDLSNGMLGSWKHFISSISSIDSSSLPFNSGYSVLLSWKTWQLYPNCCVCAMSFSPSGIGETQHFCIKLYSKILLAKCKALSPVLAKGLQTAKRPGQNSLTFHGYAMSGYCDSLP